MKRIIFLALPALLALAGCSEITSYLTPYRIDVRQGNFVTQEMIDQLKVGQTRDQVRFILGTPLVMDMFHAGRWDYVYYFKPGRGEVQQRHITVYFSEGKLTRVSGDVVASDRAAAAAKAVPPASANSGDLAPATADAAKKAMKMEPSMTAPSGL